MDYYSDVTSLGQFHEHKLVTCFRGEEYGISSLAFDPQEDLLWAATYGVSTTNPSSCRPTRSQISGLTLPIEQHSSI